VAQLKVSLLSTLVVDAAAAVIVADWQEKGQASAGRKSFDTGSCGKLLAECQPQRLKRAAEYEYSHFYAVQISK
jgi:hypothetical protein